MPLPPARRGQRLNRALINSIIGQANLVAKIDPGIGRLVNVTKGGVKFSDSAMLAMMREPATSVVVYNYGTEAIAAYSPAGIVESAPKEDSELLNHRAFAVRLPEPEDAGNFVITQEALDPGQAGLAWISGVVPVRFLRWFEAEQLERADILAGERYALASFDGSLDVVWAQRDDDDHPIVNEEHWAVVRFNGRRYTLWRNYDGGVDVPLGCPVVPVSDDEDGLVDGEKIGVLNLRRATASDDLTLTYVNVGGTVEPGRYGRCSLEPTIARMADEYDVGTNVGAASGEEEMSDAGSGFQVLARVGEFDDVDYAIIKPASAGAPAYRLQIVQGNTLATGQDGIKFSASEITNLSAGYDPDTPGSAMDGIGWALLTVNGVSRGYVLACNDGSGGSLIGFDLVGGSDPDTCTAIPTRKKTVTVGGDPNVTREVYVPDVIVFE